ncbi:MAG: EscU/YscU/HrcU family type III secretion system export apparatus switch protein [Scytonema sp. RU_4_4]|nr:EscU/YscU/HrcU family type III secretion system export apparatus switch protein [Scytonema sp. RU_4_4]
MTQAPQPSQEPNILGKFASVVGLLGIALFFAGWIYRWSYFYFFQLEVTNLDFPAQSFLFVPLQIFLGDGWAVFRTVLAFILAIIAIQLTLWLIQLITKAFVNTFNQILSTRIIPATERRRSWIAKQLNSLVNSLAIFSSQQLRSVEFLRSLVNEIVIVSWVLIVIFWLARWQGIADARRDASQNSTLPVVALITPEEKFALGRKLDDVFADPPLKGYRILGDRGLFDDLRGKEDTDISNPNQPRVWRILLERGGWIYLFQALPANAKANERPLVLAVQQGDKGHVLIRSPEVSKTK